MATSIFRDASPPFVVFSENDSGMAIIPAALMGGGTRVGLIGEALFDYRTVMSVGDDAALRNAWAEIASLNLPLHFYSLRGEHEQQRLSEFDPQFFCNALRACPTQQSYDDFQRQHTRLASRARRIARKGLGLHQYNGSDSALIRTIYELKSHQPTPQGNLFANPLRREFMVQVAAAQPHACEVYTYETAGSLVSAIVVFRHENVRHCYTVYYDTRWADLSPGQILLYEITARSFAEGVTCDFMTGEYPYKARVATSAVPLYRVEASVETITAVAQGRVEAERAA